MLLSICNTVHEWTNVEKFSEKERMDKTDGKMHNESTIITELEMTEDVVVNDPTSKEVDEDAAKKESVDITDKRDPNYNARQANTFAAKKTVAQGMMDVALITANANQLRYLVEYQQNSSMFYVVMILIIISLILQVIKNIYRSIH